MTPEPHWLTDREQRAWQAYRRMHLLLNARLARDLTHQSNLSEPDYDVLTNLSDSPHHRLRVHALADRLLWSRSRLSHHLTRMQRRNLITREECTTDGRGAVIALTDHGLHTLQTAAPGHVASVRHHFIDQLTPEQLDTFTTIGETVIDALTPTDHHPPPPIRQHGTHGHTDAR